ncbi:MAG: hypothetical protein LLG08_04540 [Actinomycetia bacterium]|nr:hypothetical protein [Actinomycetes bacterium]
MALRSVLEIVLIVLGIVLAGAGICVAVVFVRTLRDARATLAQVRERVVPMLGKADISLDALNAELLRVDGIVTDIEEVSGAVSSATDAIRTPVDAIAGLGGRLARFVSRARRS